MSSDLAMLQPPVSACSARAPQRRQAHSDALRRQLEAGRRDRDRNCAAIHRGDLSQQRVQARQAVPAV